MSHMVDTTVAKAKKLVSEGDEYGAMVLANELIALHPNDLEAWLLRGYLHELKNDYSAAVADLTRAIELNPLEPHLFLTRGINQFAQKNDQAAVSDFTKGLELCDFHNNEYYRETLHFWRAEAFLRLGKKGETLFDLAAVRDDFSFWTYELRTKLDILADCRKLAG
jgi:tetratricopeptide (TPR) repeat protein